MRKVLIPTKLDKVAADLLKQRGLTVIQNDETPLAEQAKAHPDAYALIVRSEKVNAAVLDAFPSLKVVIRAGSGYDNIDAKHARRRGVDVMNTPGANANAVAEEVIALALAAYRHVVPADQSTRAGGFEKKKFMGRELTGKTVGIVGLGNIGQLVAKRLAGFEPTLLGFDPVIAAERAEALGVKLVSLPELFAQADIVTLHVPVTDETRGMVNAELLGQMKKGALLINCARAEVVDEAALRATKAAKGLLFCNDVYPEDKPGPKTVVDVADVMLPHLGASTHEANFAAARRAAEQLIDYVERGVNTFVVNSGVPAGLDEDYQRLAYYLTRVARAYLGPNVTPHRLETSFYGGLNEYANWLLASVVMGLSSNFDPLFDWRDAAAYLAEKGITYVNRDVDERKKYGKSMTIDLYQGRGDTVQRVSVRGTVTEGRIMVSRIGDFERLYFEPRGNSVMVVYQDKPGMLTKICGVMARHGINIEDIRAPLCAETGQAMAVLKLNQPANDVILAEIVRDSGAAKAVSLQIT